MESFRERRTLQHTYDLQRWQYGLSARLAWHAVFISYRHALHPYFLKNTLENKLQIHSIGIGLQAFY